MHVRLKLLKDWNGYAPGKVFELVPRGVARYLASRGIGEIMTTTIRRKQRKSKAKVKQ